MATRAKKRPAAKKKKATKARAKAKVTRKAAPKKKVAAKARVKKASDGTKKPSAERKRLLAEERALERDVDNAPETNRLSESPEYIPEAMNDSLAEELGEGAVASAVSGDQEDENIRDEDVPEEEGGPFVNTSAEQQFAGGIDGSNPEDAEPAAFPTTSRAR
jgi:hypothetical protein